KELLEAKLGRPVGSLTHAELGRALVARGMREELAQRVVDELESCDFARFSAAGIRGEEMESCLARTKELLGELDRFPATKEEEPCPASRRRSRSRARSLRSAPAPTRSPRSSRRRTPPTTAATTTGPRAATGA